MPRSCTSVALPGGGVAIACGARPPKPTHCRAPFELVGGRERCGAHRDCRRHYVLREPGCGGTACGRCETTWQLQRREAPKRAAQLELPMGGR